MADALALVGAQLGHRVGHPVKQFAAAGGQAGAAGLELHHTVAQQVIQYVLLVLVGRHTQAVDDLVSGVQRRGEGAGDLLARGLIVTLAAQPDLRAVDFQLTAVDLLERAVQQLAYVLGPVRRGHHAAHGEAVDHIAHAIDLLQAGQHVITGSYAGFLDVPANQDIELTYGDLGVLRLRFNH
ncbi:hypothetical protein G6F64_014178 [Rhizopus arrhizus]|uniref:Uncharacterized protein n=1 Tax=Rhizopus oryzae TaxID=64495 RepID=A0A9P7BK20_RHIOR|nr:hypothetical protein G6F64_014178 [Rhizopus arrhizus]